MHHLIFSSNEQGKYPVCFLVPSIRKDEIQKAYLDPFALDPNDLLVLDLHYSQSAKKTPAKEMKAYIEEELVPVFQDMGVEYLAVCDSEYFKVLTKTAKVDANLGYVLDCAFGPWKVVYVPNFKAIFYDPEKVTARIQQGMTALIAHRAGTYTPPGNEVLKSVEYPKTLQEISAALDRLLALKKPLAIDIEGFGLKHYEAGIGTISFAWSKHEGIAFPVDYQVIEDAAEAPFGKQVRNEPVRQLLRRFFKRFREKAVYHNIAYDVYVLIYQLYMGDILDTRGLLKGMGILLRDWDCTRLITYLATNSCAGNRLSLKDQAQEFAGNYGMGDDIKDITKIPLPKLLEYNLVDSYSTWHVYGKHWDTLVSDQQTGIYDTLFKPTTADIIQMQLTGLPVNMARVLEVEAELNAEQDRTLAEMQATKAVSAYNYHRLEKHTAKMNAEWKTKRMTVAEMEAQALIHEPTRKETTFNPNSAPQLQELLYDILGLPVIGYTDNGQPSSDGDTIKALQKHTTDADILKLLKGLEDYAAVNKIITDFIPSLKNAQQGPDGWHYLFGNFNLGGTKSGRLSSSKPNLQNLPANSKYAKAIKSCIEAPPGWIFLGLDFSSLEDRISALTTKDPNKLKVYTDGYDGHSLRAYSYFGDQMPDIDPTSVTSINSIQDKYKSQRQESKVPTFLLTYAGTFKGIMEQCGFSAEKAKSIEAKYHELYQVSDKWVADKLDQASIDGYVTVAFGLRVRTPLLAQVIRGTSKTPSEAVAEGRSAGNALGQSWCLLNSRAWVEFMEKVRASAHSMDIRPCAQIHDAGYALVRDDVDVVAYVNKHLVEAVKWQDHPDIWHDQVKLGGEVSLFWPNWSNEIVIPNEATAADIPTIVGAALAA